uniref:ABC transporter domain-containing protein n=1 Tax=Skeletonema marinoi TaxID=267567 RepID=A0A7S2PJQ6_9STRA|mmetsp:Transcript_6594/g.13885  ORF Transcript_6594/g.13885 Transcript_6594/m.13885 type:complete len:548 (-) Transcript_6594:191-1834(-)
MFSLVSPRAVRPPNCLARACREARKWRGAESLAPSWERTTNTPTSYGRPPSFARAASSGTIASFKNLSFGHANTNLLENVDFSIEAGSKVTIMGQNGSGKSTIIKLLSKNLYPDEGQCIIGPGQTVACAQQTMPTASRDMTVKEFFTTQLNDESLLDHEIETKMAKALRDVVLEAPGDRIVKSFSGGQQARLLLAAALIQDPTILLMDEPTNNLDADGLYHLQSLIQMTDKTCVVISHDEDFLNAFTDQVLYLDMFSKKVETYWGDYWFVKEEIRKRIKKENAVNAQLKKKAQAKKDQANKFAGKGGGLRKVAKTMRGLAAEIEDQMQDVRREDYTLSEFTVPFSAPSGSPSGKMMRIEQVSAYNRSAKMSEPVDLGRGSRVQVTGPNGVGKTTFLEMIVDRSAPGVMIDDEADIGYYRQDFSNLDFDSTPLQCLEEVSSHRHTNEQIRKTAGRFFLGNRIMRQKVVTLSEGQKGLLSLACLCLQEPSILIMDEPTNHINFRHLPALAYAVNNFKGPVLLVSHDQHFVSSVGVNTTIDMGKVLNGKA